MVNIVVCPVVAWLPVFNVSTDDDACECSTQGTVRTPQGSPSAPEVDSVLRLA